MQLRQLSRLVLYVVRELDPRAVALLLISGGPGSEAGTDDGCLGQSHKCQTFRAVPDPIRDHGRSCSPHPMNLGQGLE